MEQERWQRISQVLEASLEQEPGQRAQLLDEACGGDEDLRREGESLLAFEPELKNYLDQPVLEGVSEAPAEQQKRSWVGRQIGVYRPKPRQELEGIAVGELVVENGDVALDPADGCFGRPAGRDFLHDMSARFEPAAQGRPELRFVVDEQDPAGRHAHSPRWAR